LIRYHTCALCEAHCGIEVELDGHEIRRIRGDRDDVLSGGHICPKGVALADLHNDPDRIREPQLREGDTWRAIGWDEAIDRAVVGLDAVQRAHGRSSVATYLGNPNVHHHGNLLSIVVFQKALASRNRFSATSADQLPHMFAALHMFGHQLMLGVPDLDRTEHLLILGANPWASNGSLMTAGDVRKRVQGIQQRGGRVVVVDPRRTETAGAADAHHFIRPGTDAALLLGMLHVVFAEGLEDLSAWSDASGVDALRALATRFPPARVAPFCGITPDTIAQLARDLARAPRAALYGRFGVCTQEFGGLSAWLCYVLNLVTGNLDREGGLMFAEPAADLVDLGARSGHGGSFGRWRSRVRGLPEFGGELPVSAIAEEMTTPGEGQIRGLVTVAGNPVLSAPQGHAVEAALPGLEFMVSVDLYRNETTRHAHLILPASPPLSRDSYALAFHALAVRNTAKFSPAIVPADPGTRDDADILLDLAAGLARRKQRWGALSAALGLKGVGMRRALDGLLRMGPHGSALFGDGLTVNGLLDAPHGVDLGALTPNLRRRLRTRSGRLEAAPGVLLADVPRLEAALDRDVPALVLVGRRQLRSCNSWMHNSTRLVKGKPRCTLLLHPDDAATRGIEDGAEVTVTSRTGTVRVLVEVSDEIAPGVVSLPHGWGHRGGRQQVALDHAGVSVNDLTDASFLDPLTGNAGFSGVPVEVSR
jgi:anaerobic selenocysteine-containing dehydrogenase